MNEPMTPADNQNAPMAVASGALLGIGSTIWIFDINRRVYKDNRSGPVYREHWRQATITGETSRSWTIEPWSQKVPKKGEHPGVSFTAQEVDDDVWLNAHRYKVSDLVNRLRNAETLRAIAKLVGYDA